MGLFSYLPEPRCKVHPVLTCEDAPSRRKTVASPLLYRAGPWAAQAPRAHAPVHVKGFYSVLSRDSLEVMFYSSVHCSCKLETVAEKYCGITE